MKALINISIFTTFICVINCLTCDEYYDHDNYGLGCIVHNLSDLSLLDGKPSNKNSTVKYFQGSGTELTKFEIGKLKTLFLNLERIILDTPNLKRLCKNDLSELGDNLKYLKIEASSIEFLPGDLFEDTKNILDLKIISNAKIKSIDEKTFEPLKYLNETHLDFECMKRDNIQGGRQETGREKVEEIINEVIRDCFKSDVEIPETCGVIALPTSDSTDTTNDSTVTDSTEKTSTKEPQTPTENPPDKGDMDSGWIWWVVTPLIIIFGVLLGLPIIYYFYKKNSSFSSLCDRYAFTKRIISLAERCDEEINKFINWCKQKFCGKKTESDVEAVGLRDNTTAPTSSENSQSLNVEENSQNSSDGKKFRVSKKDDEML